MLKSEAKSSKRYWIKAPIGVVISLVVLTNETVREYIGWKFLEVAGISKIVTLKPHHMKNGVFTVPPDALYFDKHQRSFIFVLRGSPLKDAKEEKIEVEVVSRNPQQVTIFSEALTEGDQVVIISAKKPSQEK